MSQYKTEIGGYEPGSECGICRGRCCREKGCSLSPEDMVRFFSKIGENGENPDRDKMLKLLTDERYGLFAIDSFWHEREPVYYLRMKHKCYNFIGVDAAGECIALTDEGCSLDMAAECLRAVRISNVIRSIRQMRCTQTGCRIRIC